MCALLNVGLLNTLLIITKNYAGGSAPEQRVKQGDEPCATHLTRGARENAKQLQVFKIFTRKHIEKAL